MAATGPELRALSGRYGLRERAVERASNVRGREAETEWSTLLLETIQTEIIPQLLVAHRAGAAEATEAAASEPADAWEHSVAHLTELVLGDDPNAAASYVRELRARGRGTAALLLQLLAPTARELGSLWVSDEQSFTDVTLALGRLQALLWDLSLTARDADFSATAPTRGRALVAAAPGEQHSFGASMVAEFFRWGGWDVVAGPRPTRRNLINTINAEACVVIGLSLCTDRGLDDLADDIEAIRSDAKDADVTIMVGGRTFVECPRLAADIGADGTTETAQNACAVASSIVAKKKQFED